MIGKEIAEELSMLSMSHGRVNGGINQFVEVHQSGLAQST